MVLAVVLGLVAVLWIAPAIATAISAVDLYDLEHVYSFIGMFVVFDAVVPVFPSESLLTTASNLGAQPGSQIELWRVVIVGAIGAIIGDSLLYWLSRTVFRRSFSERLERAQRNEKVAHSMAVLSRTAPTLIVFGRYVPGFRFVLGASMGITRYPYPRFLLWAAIGGTTWAAYTCVVSFMVASIIEGKPVVSIIVSALTTTALLGLLYRPLKRNWDAAAPPDSAQVDDPIGAAEA